MEVLKEKEILKPKVKNTVFMEHIYSMEYYKNGDGEIKQVLKDINFKANKGESFVVTGENLFEIQLLLEILANTKPYQKGKCVLVETGMMRKKRVILNHTFYIGTVEMPFNNMRVLEYISMATGKGKKRDIERQEEILDLLVELELGYISLSEINKIKESEKSLITLLLSALSESELIVFNIPSLRFDERGMVGLKNICEYIKKKEKTLILSTVDMECANRVCDNILILKDSKTIYVGSKERFRESFDKVGFRVWTLENDKIIKYLEKQGKGLKCLKTKDYIEVLNVKDKENFYNLLLDSKIEILKLEKNILNVKNGYRELVKNYDL